ncbi:MAG: zinc ribbon domain-containing protein [Candidatus Hydrogenedentes bacterium]|nr:zinc ribbon domain-containing protein [Candidatus Hydrogenedentota bacterium]
MNEVTLFIAAFVAVGILAACSWIINHRLDKRRITRVIGYSGGVVLKIEWTPFGKGWLFENRCRFYDVTFRNNNGEIVTATCKTSMWMGVYWTGEAVPSFAPSPAQSALEHVACNSCGYALQTDWIVCPQCGAARRI